MSIKSALERAGVMAARFASIEGRSTRTQDAAVHRLAPDDVVLEMNPLLDREKLAETFRRESRIRVANILTDPAAERLFHALEHETPWGLIFNKGRQVAELKSVSHEKHQKIVLAACERARTSFQYVHHHFRLSEGEKIYPAPDHYLGKLVRFLRAPEFINFMRELTGMEIRGLQSATATLFMPHHFLTVHDDEDVNRRRLVAFSLNMTPQWRLDWGGALQFYDSSDHIEEGYLPTFNALNLFRVPKRHSVSQVAAFGGKRYSVAGWFES